MAELPLSVWEAIVLGLLQGLTEFLPVSSSAHLVIGHTLFGLSEDLTFDVMLHAATLVAILVYFRRRLVRLVRTLDVRYVGKLCLATVPVAGVGIAFHDAVEAAFGTPLLVAGFLFVTGVALLSLYLRRGDDGQHAAWGAGRSEPTWAGALLIGCAQAAAILPGISRSGSTIVAAIWLGVAPAAAAEFSFLLGIPAILGAIVVESSGIGAELRSGLGAELLFGMGVAFVSGLITIRLVFRLLASNSFRRFGFYCWAVAVAFAGWLLATGAGG